VSFQEIERARVYKGADYTDNSHPKWGNLVLLNDGQAIFGGKKYVREDTLPKEEPRAEWEQELLAAQDKPGKPRFKAGDRVVLSGRTHAFGGQGGTVHEDTFSEERLNYDVAVTPDSVTDGFPVWFYDSEVDFEPTPPPVTHRYPEGLYEATKDASFRVYVQQEDETDRYTITYLTGTRDEQGLPGVNKRMSANVVASYTLVTAA
jgi:hypothetical protein